MLRVAQTRWKDCGIVARAWKNQSGRSCCIDFPARSWFDLCILWMLVFGRNARHNSTAASTKFDNYIANRSHDSRCVEKWHRTLHSKYYQIAQNARGSRIDWSKKLATNPWYRWQSKEKIGRNCKQFIGFDRLLRLQRINMRPIERSHYDAQVS